MGQKKKLLNVQDVSEMLGENVDWVYRAAREGIIPSVRLGRKVKFSEEAITEFIRSGGKALPGVWRREA
ncbi:MAG: DNA-binding protein [Tindallia sp. MSAO_Bac2]|nr:MAG: DNA-binding protein [Tindallia sp. MSAO_Bac2]